MQGIFMLALALNAWLFGSSPTHHQVQQTPPRPHLRQIADARALQREDDDATANRPRVAPTATVSGIKTTHRV